MNSFDKPSSKQNEAENRLTRRFYFSYISILIVTLIVLAVLFIRIV